LALKTNSNPKEVVLDDQVDRNLDFGWRTAERFLVKIAFISIKSPNSSRNSINKLKIL
jgi:hypothetical protein